LYASPNMISAINSKRMSWREHVTHMVEMRNAYKMLVGNHEGKKPLKDSCIDGKIILEWILGK